MRRGSRVVVALAALAGVQLALWLAYRAVERRRAGEPGPASFSYQALSGRAPAGEAPLERPDGSSTRLQDHEGDSVIVHFWATWCAPCRTELPTLLELAREPPGRRRVVVVLVSVDESWATVRHYFGDSVPVEVVRDATGALQSAYGVTTLPDTYVLERGSFVARMQGPRDWRSAAARSGVEKLGATP
ncbi:MAG: TlpA family protein disulfide reductase [Polyangiaceae bacterium]|nr:TlpA family protein disulfide reductase [Polyangiaceae bacterium]